MDQNVGHSSCTKQIFIQSNDLLNDNIPPTNTATE